MIYLLDTNVVSELLRTRVDPCVVSWSEKQSFESQAISVVTLAEMRFGLELMTHGRRRAALESAVQFTLPARFGDRLLPVGSEVAEIYGHLLAHCRRSGLEVGDRDLLIAATALVGELILATRNTAHFEPLGVRVVNPWLDD